MTKTFTFFSEYLNQTLEVEIDIHATEDEAWVDSLELYNDEGDLIPESYLPSSEMASINETASDIANENGYDVYQESLIAKGDALYDEYKDMGMDNAHSEAMNIMSESGYETVSDENG